MLVSFNVYRETKGDSFSVAKRLTKQEQERNGIPQSRLSVSTVVTSCILSPKYPAHHFKKLCKLSLKCLKRDTLPRPCLHPQGQICSQFIKIKGTSWIIYAKTLMCPLSEFMLGLCFSFYIWMHEKWTHIKMGSRFSVKASPSKYLPEVSHKVSCIFGNSSPLLRK